MVFIPATEGKPGQAASYYYNKISDTVLYMLQMFISLPTLEIQEHGIIT